MSSGIKTHGSRGLPATGAVTTVRTGAVLGSIGTPQSLTSSGVNRPTSIATGAHRTRPVALFAIAANDVDAMANVCRMCVAKPNVSPFTVTEAKADVGECEDGHRDADPEESIREYRPFQSDQNGIHLERCEYVLHDDKDVEADCRIQQLAE